MTGARKYLHAWRARRYARRVAAAHDRALRARDEMDARRCEDAFREAAR